MVDHYGILHSLGIYDSYRGWGGYKYGSPVWSDIRSWENVKPEDTYGFNIVGHTQCANNPIILNNIIDLDCRKPFYIDENGNIFDFLTKKLFLNKKINIFVKSLYFFKTITIYNRNSENIYVILYKYRTTLIGI